MIQVCDAIMGTGKSSAAINYMNEHPEKKFIYVTPYLDEAERIKNGCPQMHFVEPSDRLKRYHFKKCEHTASLIKQGRNITTTHQAFKRYTSEMLDDIRSNGYSLLIDENIDILERYDIDSGDVQVLMDSGHLQMSDGVFHPTDKAYTGSLFSELFRFLEVRDLIQLDSDDKTQLYYWALPPELLTSFENVIIMTYLFRGQSLRYMLDMYQMEYKYIGIQKTGERDYHFGEYPGYTPDYVSHIKDMIHILENKRMNAIGDGIHALSMNWFEKDSSDLEQLRNNMNNCINNIWAGTPAGKKLWGSYNGKYNAIKGKGYTKSFLTFNARATNAYKDRTCLVYIANLFMNVNEKSFYKKYGIEVDEEMYALSIMLQWIWRSAIREGQEINIYIPSSRMRTLLLDWMDKVSKEGNSFGK